MDTTRKSWLREHGLTLLIAAQPLLDALAFWTANEQATVAGYIRLLIMAALPLWLLIKGRERKKLLLALGVMAVFALLHMFNDYRVGWYGPVFDASYLAKVLQMPVLAVCFTILIRDEGTKRQALRGIALAAVLTIALVLIAWITGTGLHTYPEGYGYSGWVIDDNRCAQSILLVTLSVFSVSFALQSGRRWLELLIPGIVTAVFLTNGTKGCYLSLFAIFFCFAAFLLLEKPVLGKRVRGVTALWLMLLMVFSVVIYPYTPRAKMDMTLERAAKPGEIEAALAERGIDITNMSAQERFDDPVVHEVFQYYYEGYLGVLPDIYDRFGMDRVMLHYGMTTDVDLLIDVRVMERSYSAMIWEDGDLLTKLLGIETTQLGPARSYDGAYDMENDWPALFYFYGILGFALYVAFLGVFLWRVVRKLLRDFRGSFTLENVTLVVCLFLQLGLAQFSGAILRRPNVNIYLALVLALIAYQTRTGEAEKGGSACS